MPAISSLNACTHTGIVSVCTQCGTSIYVRVLEIAAKSLVY